MFNLFVLDVMGPGAVIVIGAMFLVVIIIILIVLSLIVRSILRKIKKQVELEDEGEL